MYQEPEKHDPRERRKSIKTNPPSDLYVGIGKDVKVAIITMFNKVYSEWKKREEISAEKQKLLF